MDAFNDALSYAVIVSLVVWCILLLYRIEKRVKILEIALVGENEDIPL